nr:MAG TPA: hypothetical protein [Caudoviricetes sp.]
MIGDLPFIYHKKGSIPFRLSRAGCEGSKVRFLVICGYGNNYNLTLVRQMTWTASPSKH